MSYGNAPIALSLIPIEAPEMMFVQYLPIVMPKGNLALPEALLCFFPLVEMVMKYVKKDDYLYITVKHLYVSSGCSGNREGWHSDGFGTNDINFIWSDSSPTEFCVQPFVLSDDCDVSMKEMTQQVKAENIRTYPNNTLLRLDRLVIHRVSPIQITGMRTFVKLSISQDRYNLKGNAHNYLLDYNWELQDRETERNHPFKG
jgi:hypothetical protein